MYDHIPLLPELISRLVHREISEEEFWRHYGIPPEDGEKFAWELVERAAATRDPRALTLSLSLVFHFGISRDHLETLLQLARADWHYDHENVLEALSDLQDPATVDTIDMMARARYQYREYDDAHSLRVKCAWLLSRIQTPNAVSALGRLFRESHGDLKEVARKRLQHMERDGESDEIRELASRTLHEEHLS